ncbi:MAG: serine hydrolase domain-containing protein [Erysipelotrichaceae bacterium]
MSFEAFINEIKEKKLKVFGVEQYYDGQLINSWGDTTEGIYPLHSITKSILSIAVGIAYDNKKLSLDDSIGNYLPKHYWDKMNDKQKTAYEKLTVHRLLTMSVVDFPFNIADDNYLANILAIPLNNFDIYRFNYSNITAYLMAVVLTSALETDLWQFINANILQPLAINKAQYSLTTDGYFYGASKMMLSVNDVSKIGLLLYNQGIYQNQTIVSKQYINLATTKQIDNIEGGYGYYFWQYQDGFSMNGSHKQRCYILPKRKTIITFLSDIPDGSNQIEEMMENQLL